MKGTKDRLVVLIVALTVLTLKTTAGTPYKVIQVEDGGTITGFVRLSGDVPKNLDFEISKDNDWCGKKKFSPRLVLGKDKGIANSVVSIENISQGKKQDVMRKFTLDQRKCQYEPHIMLVPIEAGMEIVNSDAILHNVHTYESDEKTVFNIAQPIKGFRFPIKPGRFKNPGPYHATCDAGHPWMSAYIVVTEHPYYAVTGVDGKFELKDVPPGNYRVRMWHEGVAVTRMEMEAGKPKSYKYEAPYERIHDVVVSKNATVKINFDLALRAAQGSSK